MKRTLMRAGVAAVSIALLASCGQQSSDRTADPSNGTASATAKTAEGQPTLGRDGSALLEQLSSSIDFRVWKSAEDLAAEAPVVLTGAVESVVPGQEILTEEGEGKFSRDSSVVLRIKVDGRIKVASGIADGGIAYVALPRGLDLIDESGELLGPDVNPTLADFQKAFQVGLRVVVASWPQESRIDNPDYQRVGEDPNRVPSGATLLQGMHPQTVTFDQGENALDYWGNYSFAAFVDELT